MNLINTIYDNKEKIGKTLFAISFIIFIYMFFSPSTQTCIHVDEKFTVNLIKLPLTDFFAKVIADVHPPLYYFIIQFMGSILTLIHIPIDYLKLSKFVSIISYGILLSIAATKIKNEYNWFVAGLFAFTIATMSGFFIQFTTSRMYGWATLLLVLSFIYFKDVFFKSDRESWLLFIAFSILAAYTQYYLIFTIGFMYLILLYDLLSNKHENVGTEIKKVFLALVASFVLYIPQLVILSMQMSTSHNNSGGNKSLFDLISYISVGNYTATSLTVLFLKIITIFLMCGIIVLAIRKYKKSPKIDEKYILTGIILFILTFLLGANILPNLIGSFNGRYLLAAIGIFWLSTSLLMEKLENKNIFSLFLLTIILLGAIGIAYNIEESTKLYDEGINSIQILKEINNPDSVIIYHYGNIYHNYHDELNETKEYAQDLTAIPYAHNVTINKNITRIIDENPNKNIYYITNTNKVDGFDNIISKGTLTNTYYVIQLKQK